MKSGPNPRPPPAHDPYTPAVEPFRLTVRRSGPMAHWDAAIVVPAMDEEARVQACLDAAHAAIRRAGDLTVGLVLVVNNTSDRTAAQAWGWAASRGCAPFVLLDCAFRPQEAGVGAARRLGMHTACAHLAGHGAILTTDADTLVREDWVIGNLSELRDAELICGTVLRRADEARALPAAIGAHGTIEGDYAAASIAFVAWLDPQAHDPAPAHHKAAGASMGVTRRVYEAVGGMPALPMSEDRAFAERVREHDFRVRYSGAVAVETSCRMTGRTGGGLAGALRARATEQDPLADQWMETADALAFRHGLLGRLRASWPHAPALHAVLTGALGPLQADRIMAGPTGPHLGAFFAAVERRTPGLARTRLRLSDCRRELPGLRALLASLNSTPRAHALHAGPGIDRHASF